MDRDLAKRILDKIEELNPFFNDLTFLSEEISEKKEAKQIRRYLGDAMSRLAYDIVMFIIRQYPDLDPDKNNYYYEVQVLNDDSANLKEKKRKYAKGGELVEEAEFLNGRIHGLRKFFGSNMNVLSEALYQDGLLNGLSRHWYANGKLHIECNYLDDDLHGVYKSFWNNGKPKEEGKFYRGTKIEKYKYFDMDGNLRSGHDFGEPNHTPIWDPAKKPDK